MGRIKYIFASLCILLPLFTLFYKSQHLNLSLIPMEAQNLWQIELKLNWRAAGHNPSPELRSFFLPIPQSSPSQIVRSVETTPAYQPENVKKQSGGPLLYLRPQEVLEKTTFRVAGKVQLFGHTDLTQTKFRDRLHEEEQEDYTSLDGLEEKTLKKLKDLSESLIFTSDSQLEALRKIFFYISDEMIIQPNVDDLGDVLSLGSGSYLGQAQLLMYLARYNKIPARLSFGVQILNPGLSGEYKYIRVFYSEVFINGRWAPINPDSKDFGTMKDNFIVIHRDCEKFKDSFNDKDLISIYTEPIKYTNFSSEKYLSELSSQHSFWSFLSLHRFPLSVQAIFFGLLLIPFGTVILSFARVMIGINTFGIFTPILLTLFFLETSFSFGFIFFLLVVFIGFGQRYILDKFYLLAVPRLSVLLTFVILFYILFAIFVDYFGILNAGSRTLNYFPIVIVTVFIERFCVFFIEEGARNTLKTALGTLFVASLCYFLLSFNLLKVILFNNPELLLLSIGFNIFIGSYKGYRLIEFFRFAGLRQIK